MVAYPDCGAGNDPKIFVAVVWGGGGSLSPLRLNIFTVGNMGVMISLGQGGLRSQSASSFNIGYMFMYKVTNKPRGLGQNVL